MAEDFTPAAARSAADNRRAISDRRAHPRNGRRNGEVVVPWYRRRRLWLAIASLVYVGWRRFAPRTRG